jgi:Na+/H+ antiporter NhaC
MTHRYLFLPSHFKHEAKFQKGSDSDSCTPHPLFFTIKAWGLPCIASLLSYVISFATGSSFGTMGILFPLIGPLAWALGGGSTTLLLHCFGSVYGGSLFGNMFSPIADTSILTSLACRINLQEHVTTAGPYACLVGLSCLLLGDLPVGLGVYGPFAALGVIWTAQTAVLSFFGKRGLPKAKTAPGAAPGTPQVAV